MNFYERHSYSDGQIMFNRILFSFVVVFKIIIENNCLFFFIISKLFDNKTNSHIAD